MPTDCATIAKFKETVSKELQERFMDKTSVKNNEPTCALLAETLDPRYKNLAMENEATRSVVIEKLTQLLDINDSKEIQESERSIDEIALNFQLFRTHNPNRSFGANRF